MDDAAPAGSSRRTVLRVQPLSDVPAALRGRPFSSAEARRHGVSEQALRHERFRSPHRGVHVLAALEETPLLAASAAVLALPPDAALCRTTAARLHGWPLPADADRRVHAAVSDPARVPHLRGVVTHQGLPEQDVVLVSGMRVTGAARTFCDLAVELRTGDLVALGDAMLWRRAPVLAAEDLRAAVEACRRRRGVVRMREALALVSDGAQSPRETALRLLLLRAGLPAPLCNEDVVDGAGCFLARPDLQWPDWRVAVEYDGDHHRSREQWELDLRRRERLERAGWAVVVVTAATMRAPALVAHRVRAALLQHGFPV